MWPFRSPPPPRTTSKILEVPMGPPAPHLYYKGGLKEGYPPTSGGPAHILSHRFGTEIRTASRASFGSTPRRPRTGRGAPEQVNYKVNPTSTISLQAGARDAPRPLLESQPVPPRALCRPILPDAYYYLLLTTYYLLLTTNCLLLTTTRP